MTSITDVELNKLTTLSHLDLSFNSQITIKGLQNLTNLIELNLTSNMKFLSKDIADLKQKNPTIKIIDR